MTATVEAQDVAGILARADRRYTGRSGDDPAPPDYIHALANAVRTQLGEVAGGGVVDDGAVRQLLADKERLEDLVAEFRKRDETHTATIERYQAEAKKPVPKAPGIDEARAERDTALGLLKDARADSSELANQLAAARADADNWHGEYDRVVNETLDMAREATEKQTNLEARVEELMSQLAELKAAAQKTLDEIAAADDEHKHYYPWADPDFTPLPCKCGHPYPRAVEYEDEAEVDVPPAVEPWEDVLGRIRTELAGWSA